MQLYVENGQLKGEHKMTTQTDYKPIKRGSGCDPLDVHVGNAIRQRRLLMNFSQVKLAHEVGCTFQQIQKYERGLNRVSASRLYAIAKALDVDVNYFFEGFGKLDAAKPLSDRALEVAALVNKLPSDKQLAVLEFTKVFKGE